MMRIQKWISNNSSISRRKAEELILQGRVYLNGKVVLDLGTKINPELDAIEVDGVFIGKTRLQTIVFHKPRRVMCTRNDPEGRKTVYDFLPEEFLDFHTVGRLDYHSQGLLILSNDGELTLRLTHPRYGHQKGYEVDILGQLSFEQKKQLHFGVELSDGIGKVLEIETKFESHKKSRYLVFVEEGRNRFIRRLFEFFELEVIYLKRFVHGPIQLGNLNPGEYRNLNPSELEALALLKT